MLNATAILTTAARMKDRSGHLVHNETSVSCEQMTAGMTALAAKLQALGIGPGCNVAMFCPNSLEFVALYFAIMHLGAVAVPLNVLLKREQITSCLRDCQPKAIVCGGFAEDAPPLQEALAGFKAADTPVFARICGSIDKYEVEVASGRPSTANVVSSTPAHAFPTSADDVCCIIYTSGTTGRPKGVELTHGNLFALAYAFSRHMGLSSQDRVLAGLPLFSSFGQTATLCATLLSGGDLVILPRFGGEQALEAIFRHRVTFFGGVPTMIHGVVHGAMPVGVAPQDLGRHWRLSFAGGAPAPAALLEAFRERFNIPIIHGYGLTETSAVSAFNPPSGLQKDASVGLPLWGVEMRIADEDMNSLPLGERGELVIRGPNVMKGYHNNPDANQDVFRDGWLRTGDIATLDEDGYCSIVGRLKELILRGGQNVYPHDVEEVLQHHPEVSLAAVLGVPDERLGEEVAAFVLLKEDARATSEELIAWCKERLPAFAYPRLLQIRPELPVGPTGKILKREIKVGQSAL